MKITLLVVGTLKEAYWREAEKEYLKRISPYSKIEVIELPDLPSADKASAKEEAMTKEKEGERILSKIKPGDFVCTLDLNKREMDSLELSKEIESMFVRGRSAITFVIGGSLGLGENIRKRADASISLSKLTFTHQMTRIILMEQIYRSFKIAKNEPYHK